MGPYIRFYHNRMFPPSRPRCSIQETVPPLSFYPHLILIALFLLNFMHFQIRLYFQVVILIESLAIGLNNLRYWYHPTYPTRISIDSNDLLQLHSKFLFLSDCSRFYWRLRCSIVNFKDYRQFILFYFIFLQESIPFIVYFLMIALGYPNQ